MQMQVIILYMDFVGTTVISFSDVLGNHRLIGITGLQIDLKNSDYGLAYYYLAKRINWGNPGLPYSKIHHDF